MKFSAPGIKYDIRTRLAVPQTLLKRGFFCLPIRISCVVISALSLITSLIVVSGLFTTLAASNPDEVDDDVDRIVAFLLSAVSLDIISSILLFFGSLTERKNLLIPYAVLNFVLIISAFIAMGVGSFKPTTTWKDNIISICMQGLSIYLWMIVLSYYQFMCSTSSLAEKMVA